MSIRPVKRIDKAQAVIEGAGVHLHRAFGFGKSEDYDPFLLFDDFRNDDPEKYQAGFPWHPHRGIETITYVLAGEVSHADSLGNKGVMGPGDIQWMTAGSGILHQEMPKGDNAGRMHGFQLWANLPAAQKMTKPRYQDINSSQIPELGDDDGTLVRVICGDFKGKRGPVEGIAADPRYLDIQVPAGRRKTFKVELDRHAFAYVFEGSGHFLAASEAQAVPTENPNNPDQHDSPILMPPVTHWDSDNRSLILFDKGDEVSVQAGPKGIRFLLVSGQPLKEPVAWYGPIVMNTQEEIKQAVRDLQSGSFIQD